MKKFILISIIYSLILIYFGFKLGIYARSHFDHRLISNFNDQFVKYKKRTENIYFDGFLKYMSMTERERKEMTMDCLFEMETRPWMKWIIDNQIEEGDVILDVGGATGIQWKRFEHLVKKKKLTVLITDIDKYSLEIGKKRNTNPNIKFLKIDDVNKIDQKINKILFCGVYMQMDNGAKIVKYYSEKFPNAKVIIMHSVFPDNLKTKFINLIKKNILKHTFLNQIHGRAMTDKDFKTEIRSQNLKIEKEYLPQNISNYKRKTNILKAYIILPDFEKIKI